MDRRSSPSSGSDGPIDFTRASKMCSFCGKQGGPDVRLVGGLGAMICTVCVEDFHVLDQSEESVAQRSVPPWDAMTDTELLATLPLILRSAEQNLAFSYEWVALLRERRISWEEIGRVLGVSRQAAWERFSRKVSSRGTATA